MKPIPTETATDVGSVGKWIGAAAAGALLMYVLDPDRGAARRSRAYSAVRTAGARTGASVDYALHSAGDRLSDLKDSAASVLSRGASRLHAQAAPMVERVQNRAQNAAESAAQRAQAKADRERERIIEEGERARARYDAERASERAARRTESNTYESDHRYAKSYDAQPERGLSSVLHDLANSLGGPQGSNQALLGSSVVGLLSLMRRRPAGLLVGLAGLALLLKSSGKHTYKVEPLPPAKLADERESAPFVPTGATGSQAGDSNRYLH